MALTTVALPREFTLDGRKLADPNPAFSIEEVRAHYTGIYPALNNSSYEEQLTDKVLAVKFTTSVGHKGRMRVRTPLRKMHSQTRKLLLAELDRIGRQEHTPQEQMIERFLQCPDLQVVSNSVALLTGREYRTTDRLQTPTALLPWLH